MITSGMRPYDMSEYNAQWRENLDPAYLKVEPSCLGTNLIIYRRELLNSHVWELIVINDRSATS